MKAFRILMVLIVAALGAAFWDFSSFARRADRVGSLRDLEGVEAVAALTGASDARIVSAIDLATRLKAPLLISGVHVDTTTADIAAIAGVSNAAVACCVTLGRAAASTEGNGSEITDWARRHKITRIAIVTSEYHMDRALLELRRAFPEGQFIPYAVRSTRVSPRNWWRDPLTARRLLEEWAKYRFASIRPAPVRQPVASEPPAGAEAMQVHLSGGPETRQP